MKGASSHEYIQTVPTISCFAHAGVVLGLPLLPQTRLHEIPASLFIPPTDVG
jgi:hypothetical protein